MDRPWGRKELDTIEQLTLSLTFTNRQLGQVITTSSALPLRRPQELGGRTSGASHDHHELDHTDGGGKPGARIDWREDRASRKSCCRRPRSPSTHPWGTQDNSQWRRRGPEDTPPQQLHLHTRNRHLEGEETPGVAGQPPQHLWGRRAAQAHQPRASQVGGSQMGAWPAGAGIRHLRAQSPCTLAPTWVTPGAGPAAEGGHVHRDQGGCSPQQHGRAEGGGQW